jgi:hypothetical protein
VDRLSNSEVTAQKEYGIDRNFIVKGIRAGRLEFREGSVWGNPYLRVLRRQLEQYIADELGAEHLSSGKNQTELLKNPSARLAERCQKTGENEAKRRNFRC